MTKKSRVITVCFDQEALHLKITPPSSASPEYEAQFFVPGQGQSYLPLGSPLTLPELDPAASDEDISRIVLRTYRDSKQTGGPTGARLLGGRQCGPIFVNDQQIGVIEPLGFFLEFVRTADFSIRQQRAVPGIEKETKYRFILLQEHSELPSNGGHGLALICGQETSCFEFSDQQLKNGEGIKKGHRAFLEQMLTSEGAIKQSIAGAIIDDEDGVPLLEFTDDCGGVRPLRNLYYKGFGFGGVMTVAGTALVILGTVGICSSTLGIAGFLLGLGLLVMAVSQFDKSFNRMGLFKGEGIKHFVEKITPSPSP